MKIVKYLLIRFICLAIAAVLTFCSNHLLRPFFKPDEIMGFTFTTVMFGIMWGSLMAYISSIILDIID